MCEVDCEFQYIVKHLLHNGQNVCASDLQM